MTVKFRKLLYVFYELRNILTLENLRKVYFALFHSIIQYGIIGWGVASKTVLKPLYSMQKRIVKLALRKTIYFSSSAAFKLFNVPTISQICNLRLALQAYKALVLPQGQPETRTSARTNNFRYQRTRTSFGQLSYLYKGTKIINALPFNVKAMSKSQFHIAAKLHLMYPDRVKTR